MATDPLPAEKSSGSSAESAGQTPAEPPRSWWQFSLRTMFVVVTLVVIALAWFVNGPERQRRAAAAIEAKGGFVTYAGDKDSTGEEGFLPKAYYLSVNAVVLGEGVSADELMEIVCVFPSVTNLNAGDSVSARGLAQLESLKSLEWLQLRDSQIDDETLEALSRLPKIRCLLCSGASAKVTDKGLAAVGRMTSLEKLQIGGTGMTGAGLAHLARLTKLERLQLPVIQVSDADLPHLAKLQQLKHLDFHGPITDDGLLQLKGLTRLEHLGFCDSQIKGPGLRHLRHLPALQSLALEACPIDDAGLVHLRELTSLGILWLAQVNVSDAGLDHILALPNLWSFEHEKTKITPAGDGRWQSIRPTRPVPPPSWWDSWFS